jgi:16S rRNA (guanine966-N2)-methyltransferase
MRPTADRVRESVFNVLAHGLDWAGFGDNRVLDAFAGTGAYGLEALSHGARFVCFVDIDASALLAIRRNAATLNESRAIALLRLDASSPPPPPRIASAPYVLAFLDPPYGSGLALPALQGFASRGWLAPGAISVVEVAAREPFLPPPGQLIVDERVYGAARVVFVQFRS